MVDCLCEAKEKALNEVNPHLYTIATLTGHAIIAMGFGYSVSYSIIKMHTCQYLNNAFIIHIPVSWTVILKLGSPRNQPNLCNSPH